MPGGSITSRGGPVGAAKSFSRRPSLLPAGHSAASQALWEGRQTGKRGPALTSAETGVPAAVRKHQGTWRAVTTTNEPRQVRGVSGRSPAATEGRAPPPVTPLSHLTLMLEGRWSSSSWGTEPRLQQDFGGGSVSATPVPLAQLRGGRARDEPASVSPLPCLWASPEAGDPGRPPEGPPGHLQPSCLPPWDLKMGGPRGRSSRAAPGAGTRPSHPGYSLALLRVSAASPASDLEALINDSRKPSLS